MRKMKSVERKVQELEDILCDLCGKSCMKGHEYVSMELSAYWGYASRHDLEIWSADICEDCVEQKLEPLINFQKEDAILVG